MPKSIGFSPQKISGDQARTAAKKRNVPQKTASVVEDARVAERRAAPCPGRARGGSPRAATANAKEGTKVNGPHATRPQAAAPKSDDAGDLRERVDAGCGGKARAEEAPAPRGRAPGGGRPRGGARGASTGCRRSARRSRRAGRRGGRGGGRTARGPSTASPSRRRRSSSGAVEPLPRCGRRPPSGGRRRRTTRRRARSGGAAPKSRGRRGERPHERVAEVAGEEEPEEPVGVGVPVLRAA